MGNHGKRIFLCSTTPNFNTSFEESLRNLGLNPFRDFIDRSPRSICGGKISLFKRAYRTVCYSSKLYNLIENLGFKENIDVKGLKAMLEKREYIINFLRGLYESDGSYSRHGKYGQALYIGATNKKLIQFARNCTSSLGFNFAWSEEDRSKNGFKTLYRIRISNREEIKQFLKIINPCIKRGNLP
jgi:DNA-binding transcriptional regulator WhiA